MVAGLTNAADAWVAACVPILGGLTLVQTEPWASVYRTTTLDGEIVWFKACAPHQAFEVPLTASLSARWPTTVTEVLAYDVERRWLLMADAGRRFGSLATLPSAGARSCPPTRGCRPGRLVESPTISTRACPICGSRSCPNAMTTCWPPSSRSSPTSGRALAAFRPRFTDLCAELDGRGIEPTVQHDDLHMNNVFVKDDTLRVLDWGDASISHPFFSLSRRSGSWSR